MDDLRERVALALGWSFRETQGLSWPSLRDLVRPVNPKLADHITHELKHGAHLTRSKADP